jgi:plasmid stabilization system protein ParE
MKNTYRIIWSELALRNLKEIVNYFESQWTEKELRKFARLLDKRLSSIENNPHLFPLINYSENIRRSVLSKQTTIFYQVINQDIRLVALFDNRQNPQLLNTSKPKH